MKVVVIDANLAVSLVIPLAYSNLTLSRMVEWQREQARLLVPALWHYEVLSTLRKSIVLGILSKELVSNALEKLQTLAIEEVAPQFERDERVMEWASRIGQAVAYDSVYLALAEEMGAELWTADKRLVEAAQQADVSWIHWVGEE
jgi:predicted nucleic acid-binding protein